VSNADAKADVARGDHEDVPPLSSSSRIGRFFKWKRAKRPTAFLREAGYLLLGLVSLATVTSLYFWLDVPLVAAAFTYLVVLVLLSLVTNLSSLIVFSFIGVGCLSYFFAPPIYSFRVDYPQDLITISAFMITSFVVNFLVTRGKKAEDRLRRSEAYLAEAQRLSHASSAAYNETELLHWSEESSRLFGFDPLQGIPSREAVWQRIHPDDLDRVNETIEHAVREKRSFANEFRIILLDGTVKHVESINYPVFSASGELLEIASTGIDVTARKGAEQALRESEAKFRDYAETASDWFWEIGPDYKLTLLTENAFGAPAGHQLGTACRDHALDLETDPEKWRLLLATLDSRKPFRDFVYRGLSGNGSPMYVKASGKPVFDADGEFHGYRGTGTDVTALTRAQEALRESERSARSAIDGIAGLVAIMTPNGEVETVNR